MAAAFSDKKLTFKKGFPKEIINGGNVDPKYLCVLCELVLRNPVQSFCGHRFCASCIENLRATSKESEIKCASCEKEESENEYSDLKSTFPDNAIKREFTKFATKCINDGCTWEGPFKSYIEHENSCDYQLFDCECGKQIPKHQFEEHKQEQCPNRIVICPYCNADVMAKNMEAHERECPMIPMTCQGCGKEGMIRFQLQKHQDLETGDCEARAKICPLLCGKTVEGDLKTHLSEAPGDHIMVLTEVVKKMEKKMKHMVGDDGVTVADSVPTAPLTNSSDFERLFRKVTDLEHRVAVSHSGKSQREGKTAGDGASGGGQAFLAEARSYDRGQPDGDDIIHKVKVTDTKVVQFEDTLAVLTQQLDKFREETDQLHEMNNQLKNALDTQDRKMKSLEKSIQLKDLSLAEADLKIQALEQTSYDGVMTWKITDFARKRQDAINGRMSSVYSPPFYTSKTGYKMCARLYINGDGMGKGTHLSLFFVVMKGTYDALLKWPFRQKVTLMLLDQNQHDHVVEAFRPDPNSSSFRRPTSDMNIASGCPLFCQLTQIDQTIPAYLKDDTMFIKIIVDPADL